MTTPVPIPKAATQSHLYKYSPFSGPRRDWLRETILEHCVYVPTLDQLNDPIDGRPKLAKKSEDQLFHFLYDGQFGVLRRNPHLPIDEQLMHGFVLDHNIRRYGSEFLMRELADSLNIELNGWRIYSLSKRPDSLSMWAKYAENHTGYCLEFANVSPVFQSAKEVSYGETIEFDLDSAEHRNGYWFFWKKQEWSNEEEVRILIPRHSPPKLKFDPLELTRVIMGWKMTDADKAQIRKWADERRPRLQTCRADYDAVEQVLRLRDD